MEKKTYIEISNDEKKLSSQLISVRGSLFSHLKNIGQDYIDAETEIMGSTRNFCVHEVYDYERENGLLTISYYNYFRNERDSYDISEIPEVVLDMKKEERINFFKNMFLAKKAEIDEEEKISKQQEIFGLEARLNYLKNSI